MMGLSVHIKTGKTFRTYRYAITRFAPVATDEKRMQRVTDTHTGFVPFRDKTDVCGNRFWLVTVVRVVSKRVITDRSVQNE